MLIIRELEGNGDFRSAECLKYLEEADVVITNPPFSLFREFFSLLMEYKKKFLILGARTAYGANEVFPYFKNNEVWCGAGNRTGDYYFMTPTDYNNDVYDLFDLDFHIGKVSATWFTNIVHNNMIKPLKLKERYDPLKYPKYDNYDAIEVDRTENIPMDYDGVMGVPCTFWAHYCPEQFEILGKLNPIIGGGCKFLRFLIKRKKNVNN